MKLPTIHLDVLGEDGNRTGVLIREGGHTIMTVDIEDAIGEEVFFFLAEMLRERAHRVIEPDAAEQLH